MWGLEPCFKVRGPVKRRCDYFFFNLLFTYSYSSPAGHLLFMDRLVSFNCVRKVTQFQHRRAVREAFNFLLEAGVNKLFQSAVFSHKGSTPDITQKTQGGAIF